jgi:hypothetical protein
MNVVVKEKVLHLISHILQTANEKLINRNMVLAQDFIEAPIILPRSLSAKSWERSWKKSIPVQNRTHLSSICNDLPSDPLFLYNLLNALKGSRKEAVVVKPRPVETNPTTTRQPTLTEAQIVADLLILLQGGTGDFIHFEGGNLDIPYLFLPYHRFAASEILRAVVCLNIISTLSNQLKGVVGQSIAEGLKKEYRNFIIGISSLKPNETSLLSLLSYIIGPRYERLAACTYICNIVTSETDEDSLINSVALSKNHGNPLIQNIGNNLLQLGISALIDFIRDWVLYGRLEDVHGEFFITKTKKIIESWDWWNSKYTVISNKIPSFLLDEHLIAKIVSGGRAWNFVRKYKKAESLIPSDAIFEGKEFALDMIPFFSTSAMNNAMKIMLGDVWLPGHLRTLHDFLLFFRGDFSSALFRALNSERRSETLNLLLVPLQSCTSGVYYTNRTTKEKLIDRIDFQIKSTTDRSSIRLSYRVDSPLDSVFDPESMQCYRRLSQFLWRLKCCEYHLTSNWKNVKKFQTIVRIAAGHSGLSRTQNILRYKMLTTVRALNEFFSTDVVLSSGRRLEKVLEGVADFDVMMKVHRVHVNDLMKGTFLSNAFVEYENALGLVIEVINRYADFEDEIEGLLDHIMDDIGRAENFDEECEVYLRQIREGLSDAAYQVALMSAEFEERLVSLHSLTARKDAVLELQRLELRLLFCLVRPTM